MVISEAFSTQRLPGADSELPRRRLLLVEDDWRTQTALRKILERRGWDVLSAMTVSGALALLASNPEAMILDLMLPDGDGLIVLRQARAEHPAILVAVTTGVDDRDRLEEVSDLQPDALLRKPLELAELLQILDSRGTV